MNQYELAIKFDLQTQAYIKASVLTILTYDWIITIPYEISYVWYSRWGLIKFLFIYTRYSTFVDTIMAFREQILNFHACRNISLPFSMIFAGFGIGICAMILMIWTYTLYERSRKVLGVFGLSWFVAGGVSAWAAITWSKTFGSTDAVGNSLSQKCHTERTSKIRFVAYTSLLAAETVIVALTVGKAVQLAGGLHLRRIRKTFNECGVYFYLCIYCVSVVDVVLLVIEPNRILQLDSPLRVMHTVLCCRLILHLREIAEKARGEEEETQITTLRELVGTPRRTSFDAC